MEQQSIKELTIRGIILGFLITVVFMAANIYLGLKVGMTMASSIPAAVISMAVLRYFKGSNILENNLVQSQASAAGTLSCVIFVLPGLLLVGYWAQFYFWQTFLICLSGGILGVIFTIPLRRVLVVESHLPYPEGIAAAQILKAGEDERVDRASQEKSNVNNNMQYISKAGIIAATVAFFTNGTKSLADSLSYWTSYKNAIFQFPLGFSLALVGAGYLIGITAAITILLGTIFNWQILIPILSSIYPMGAEANIQDYGLLLWKDKSRLIGVGLIGAGAVWTLITLMPALLKSVKQLGKKSLVAVQSGSLLNADTDRDISLKYLIMLFLIVLALLSLTFYITINPLNFSLFSMVTLIIFAVILAVIIGFLISATCGYMAGILGSSSSPISSIAILSIILVALGLYGISILNPEFAKPELQSFFIGLAILITSVITCIAAIANDNLQDLKTGYLVGATPAKQEWVLLIGCVAGALIAAPILNMLFFAYGFTDLLPRAGMNPNDALNAPQATLIAIITKGIFKAQMDWMFVQIGVVLGCVLMVIDKILRVKSNNKFSVPILAFGMGVYLPPTVNVPIFFGALVSWFVYKRIKSDQVAKQGMLFASGLIVGESLMGILLALSILISLNYGGSETPFALNFWNDKVAGVLGCITFFGILYYFYKKVIKVE